MNELLYKNKFPNIKIDKLSKDVKYSKIKKFLFSNMKINKNKFKYPILQSINRK